MLEGEEPHSIAMTLLDGLPSWGMEIIATDLSNRALSAARKAISPIEKAREITLRCCENACFEGQAVSTATCAQAPFCVQPYISSVST